MHRLYIKTINSPKYSDSQSSHYWGIDPLTYWRTTIETLTNQQLETALNLLAEVFEDSQQYAELSQQSKELLARSLIRANELAKQ